MKLSVSNWVVEQLEGHQKKFTDTSRGETLRKSSEIILVHLYINEGFVARLSVQHDMKTLILESQKNIHPKPTPTFLYHLDIVLLINKFSGHDNCKCLIDEFYSRRKLLLTLSCGGEGQGQGQGLGVGREGRDKKRFVTEE